MKRYIFLFATTTYLLIGGFDDGISIGEKIKIRHMAITHKNGVVGNTLYVYEADKREVVKDKEGALNVNNIHIDAKTLRKNGKLKITQIEENTKIKRISGLTKNRDILKSQQRKKSEGVEIGTVDISNTNIKNIKTYRRNNQYIIKD